MLEYPVDTTRAAVNLIMTGTTTRYPNIKFLLAHNGGALPFLAWRLAAAPAIDSRYAHMSEEGIHAEMRRFYYETAQSPGDEAIASLLNVTDIDHILFGSGWPYCRVGVVSTMLDFLEKSISVSDQDRAMIFRDNARSLLARDAIDVSDVVTADTRIEQASARVLEASLRWQSAGSTHRSGAIRIPAAGPPIFQN
jgi:predicted TIM-barrel fold metal-dependent hydrolase